MVNNLNSRKHTGSQNGQISFGELDILGFGKAKFVMDRGFYSEDSICGLYCEHVKFLVGVKLTLKFINNNLAEVYDNIRMLYKKHLAIYL